MAVEQTDIETGEQPTIDSLDIEPFISLMGSLLDLDRLRIASALVDGPADRMQLYEATGIGHRDLLRHIDNMQQACVIKLAEPAPHTPDQYSPYALNQPAFSAARRALGKHRGVRPRPTDARELTLESFMPGGKLTAFPQKQTQIVVILDELARRFEPERQYTEPEVNVILEEVNEDYCTLRRSLVDYGYMRRDKGVYVKNGA